jgi:hypothetical protein
LSSTPEFNKEQMAAVRAQRWHQEGAALLTLENAQAWVGELGLVLFAPRTQLSVPAASLVEATLGHAASAPTAAETDAARGFVARMTAEGAALPLNLLGGPGDVPDFVVSAQVFSYVFTLRGDKLWRQPPATSGGLKVSLLAAKVYEALAAGSALTAAELASELGREVTEAAIGRALVELWAQLRVIPLLQQDRSATLWELTSRRFTKAMKAGANAGQPTALSALISMYLAQAYAATEEEIETFLSPLAARSRVRDVLHGLTGARQLETVAVDGKTLLYIPGALPEFQAVAAEPVGEGAEVAAAEPAKKVGTGRIRRFEGERKPAREFRGKPARSFAERRAKVEGARSPGRFRPGSGGERAEGKSDRERRPFKREGAAGGARPSFTKPWDEERRPGTPAAESFKKFRKPGRKERKPLGDREQAGLPAERRVFSKPRFERESKARDFAKRPYTRREGGNERRESKPRSFERKERGGKPGGFGAKRPYTPRTEESGKRSFAKRPYAPRTAEGGERGSAKPRFDRGSKPGGFGGKRLYGPRTEEGGQRSFPKRPHEPSRERSSDSSESAPPKRFGAKRFGAKPAGRSEGKAAFAGKSAFGGRPKFGGKPAKGKTGFGSRPGFGGKRGGAKGPAAPKKPGPKKDERGPGAEE